MGNDNSKVREDQARLDERNKSLEKTVQQEKEFREYLETLQKERREEQIAEREKREEAEKAYQAVLEKERKRVEAEREKKEQQNREQRNREETKKQLEEKKARDQQLAQQRAKQKLDEALRENIKTRRDRVKGLKPGSTLKFSKLKFPNILNIGFFGTTGVGKTSLMNSLMFAIEGELDETNTEQASTEDFQGGHTVRRLRIQVTEHIALIDNRGVGVEDLVNAKSDTELIRQLEGRSSFVDEVDWRSGKPLKKNEEAEDRIYCTVLVFDARKAQSYYKVVKKFVTTLQNWLGRFPISVITNVDRADPKHLEELHMILRSAGISDYYDVENMTKESPILAEKYQLSLLKMMERSIKDGDRIFELRSKVEGRQGNK